MAVPGWPAPACCTASMASVRMVSIERCSMSVFAMELLVETLLSFPGRTICLCPLFPRMEHPAARRFARLAAEPVQRRGRGAAVAALERRGCEAGGAPLGGVFHPREERAEAY